MGYGYRPKDPRAKLREVVAGYVQSMRVAGRKPNAGVVFGESSDGAVPQTEGFLVEDRRSGRRYLLLEDGDVLHDPQESLAGRARRRTRDAVRQVVGGRAHGRLGVARG